MTTTLQTTQQTTEQLRSYIDRIETLNDEATNLREDIKEVYSEVSNAGFDKKAIRTIISLRKKETHERQEEQEILETYLLSLGMEL